MKKLGLSFLALALAVTPFAEATVNARNGVTITTASTINGKTPNSAINGLLLGSSGPPAPDILWWRLNEGTGTTVGDSSTGATAAATLSTSSGWTSPGASGTGSAIQGDSSSVHIDSTGTVTIGQAIISISFWVKKASWTNGDLIRLAPTGGSIDPNGLALYTLATGSFQAGPVIELNTWGSNSGNWSGYDVTAPSTGAWHHVFYVINRTSSNPTIYIDGVSVSYNRGDTGSGAAGTTSVNNRVFAVSNFFYGNAAIDDVRIWTGDKSAYVAAIMADVQ